MRVDSKDRFAEGVDNYAKYRPSYPDELMAWLVKSMKLVPGDKIADVGSGTGISSRLFAARGFEVVGVDPNESMLAKAREAGGGPTYVKGTAEQTGLPDGSVAGVTVAQAFHWLDIQKTLTEFRRILVPRGRVAAFWNAFGKTPAMDDYVALLRDMSAEYAAIPGFEATLERLNTADGVASRRGTAVPYVRYLSWDGFHGYAHSASYVVHGVDDKASFDARLRMIFDAHATDGLFPFAYNAIAIVFALEQE